MTITSETPVKGLLSQPTTVLFVRLGTGEDFRGRLLQEFVTSGAKGGAVLAAVGSFAEVVFGEAITDADEKLDMEAVTRTGEAFETGTISGNLGYTHEGEPTLHLHGLFVGSDGVFGGHLFDGTILLTLELTIMLSFDVAWIMQPHDPEPKVPMAIPRKAFLPTYIEETR